MRPRVTLAGCAVVALLAGPAAAAKDPLDGFDRFVARQLEIWKAPGASVAVVRGDQVVLLKGYGYRDLESKAPMTPRTVQPIASITKSFTVASLAVLVRDGRLSWDTPVREYLPDFRLHDDAVASRVTPRDLVTHRTGLPRHDAAWFGSSLSREELFARLRHFPLSAGLRERYQYNNLMFMTAGYLAGKVAGSSWEELVRQGIFEPLGMTASSFTIADLERQEHGRGYQHDEQDVPRPIAYQGLDAMGPTGAINSCAEDMSRYLRMLANGGSFGGRTIIAATDLVEMTNPQTVLPDDRRFPELAAAQYGMGFFVTQYRGHRFVSHGGNMPGASSQLALLPSQNAGVFVSVNLSGSSLPTVLVRNISDRLLGLDHVDWSGRLKKMDDAEKASEKSAKTQGLTPQKKDTRPSHPLSELVGEYEHPGYGPVSIAADANGELTFSYNNRSSPLRHFHYDVFQVPENKLDEYEKLKVQFVTDLDGEVTALRAQLEPRLAAAEFTRVADKDLRDPAVLERFVGEYVLGPDTMKIALREDGKLTFSLPGAPLRELVGLRATRFAIKDLPGQTLEFIADASGAIVQAAFYTPFGNFAAPKRSQ
jgi:CubicO group peptidase (beta-lactamase class C family)